MNESKRNILYEEGRVLLSYVLNISPSEVLINRYVEAIKKLKNGVPLNIPNIICFFPILLIIFENKILFKKINSELDNRIFIALVISEASTENVNKFILNEDKNRYLAYIYIIYILNIELFIKIIRPFLIPFLLLFINKRFRSII